MQCLAWNQPLVLGNYPVSAISSVNNNNNNFITVKDVRGFWTYLGMMKDQTSS